MTKLSELKNGSIIRYKEPEYIYYYLITSSSPKKFQFWSFVKDNKKWYAAKVGPTELTTADIQNPRSPIRRGDLYSSRSFIKILFEQDYAGEI